MFSSGFGEKFFKFNSKSKFKGSITDTKRALLADFLGFYVKFLFVVILVLSDFTYAAVLRSPWPVYLGQEGFIVEDKLGDLRVEDLLEGNCPANRRCLDASNLGLSRRSSDVTWYVSKLLNASEDSELLIRTFSIIKSISWFVVADGVVVDQVDSYVRNSQSFFSPYSHMSVNIPINSDVVLIARVEPLTYFIPNFIVGDMAAISRIDFISASISFISLGVMGIIVIYNILLFLMSRDVNYVLYLVFCLGIFLPVYLNSVHPMITSSIHSSAGAAPLQLSMIGFLLLLSHYFSVRKRMLYMWFGVVILLVVSGFTAIISYVDAGLAAMLMVSTWFLLIVFSTAICFLSISYRRVEASLFIIGLGALSCGALFYILGALRIIDHVILTGNLYKLCQLLQVFFISAALAKRERSDTLSLFRSGNDENTIKTMVASLHNQVMGTINVITSNVEQVGNHRVSSEVGLLLNRIERGVKAMKSVDLEMRRIGSMGGQKKSMALDSVSLLSAFDELSFVFQHKLKAKRIDLKVFCSYDIHVRATRSSLVHQVLGNILSNAIKFSQYDSSISVSVEKSDNFVDIIIKDSGIGMSPELLANIFVKGKATSREGTAGEAGTGFGLQLAASWVRGFGGNIRAESLGGEGATFIVSLPYIHRGNMEAS